MTDPVVPTFSGPKLTPYGQKCVTVDNYEKNVAILQAPHAHRKIELLTVMHSGTSAFRKRRQLRILGAQELAFADGCTFFVGMGDPDHGLWLAA